MNFKPTKFICDATTQKMRILQDVKQMWANMGLGDLGYTPEPIYHELVINFLSSVVLHFKNEAAKVASEGTLSFLLSGLLYEMSIDEMCTLFGFENKREGFSFPKFPGAFLLWKEIGLPDFVSRQAKITMIGNPVIRGVAKYLGQLLLGK